MEGLTDHFAQPAGGTPLDEDDIEGLIPSWVTTRGELDQAEGANILVARTWAFSGRLRTSDWLLTPDRLHDLHRRMFGEVWRWAGTTRRKDTNIGVEWTHISAELRNFCDDVRAQIGDGTGLAYPATELATRFHHRLVAIHPYRNGNGRHSRLVADVLIKALGEPPFTWGGGDPLSAGEVRDAYLRALRKADGYDYTDLVAFVRS